MRSLDLYIEGKNIFDSLDKLYVACTDLNCFRCRIRYRPSIV